MDLKPSKYSARRDGRYFPALTWIGNVALEGNIPASFRLQFVIGGTGSQKKVLRIARVMHGTKYVPPTTYNDEYQTDYQDNIANATISGLYADARTEMKYRNVRLNYFPIDLAQVQKFVDMFKLVESTDGIAVMANRNNLNSLMYARFASLGHTLWRQHDDGTGVYICPITYQEIVGSESTSQLYDTGE